MLLAIAWHGPAQALGTAAGTIIENVAEVDYLIGDQTISQQSNTAQLAVNEIIDVDVTLLSPPVTVSPGQTGSGLLYRITNTGNGREVVLLAAESSVPGDDFDPILPAGAIFFDSDGSGDLSAPDTPYQPGLNDPDLEPDASVAVIVINDIPPGVADGNAGLSAMIATNAVASGTPGTVFPGIGDGGVNAILGASGGSDDDTGEYLVSALTVSLAKSATVLDPDGGDRPVPGAEITYRIDVIPDGSATITDSLFTDLIPLNTTYVPGSLTLNGMPLSDAGDSDSGEFVSDPDPAVHVGLGDLTGASGTQTITFVVSIN